MPKIAQDFLEELEISILSFLFSDASLNSLLPP
jgi:hypothetical protein